MLWLVAYLTGFPPAGLYALNWAHGLTLERHPGARGMKEVVNTARVHLAVFSGLQLKMVVIFFNYCIEDIG